MRIVDVKRKLFLNFEKHRQIAEEKFKQPNGLFKCPWCCKDFLSLEPGSHICED